MSFALQANVAFLLLQNAALLALGAMGYCQLRHWLQRRLPPQMELLLYGFVFGLLGIISILAAIEPRLGIKLDLRNALVAVTTLFGGLEAGVTATLAIGLFRATLGGAGVGAGLSSLGATFALSAGYLTLLRRRGRAVSWRELAMLGLGAGAVGLAVVALFPRPEVAALVLRDFALTWVVMMLLTVVFIGGIVLQFERARATSGRLKETESELRAIMDNAPIAIFLKDRSRRFRMINRCYTEWTGFTPEQIYGKTSSEILSAAFAARAEESDRDVLERGTITRMELPSEVAAAHNPAIEHALATKFPVRDEAGAIVGIAGFTLDITESKRTEAALRASEQRFRTLIEHSAGAIMILSPDGIMRYRAPSRSARALGYEDHEVFGSQILERIHPDDAASVAAMLRDVARMPGGHAAGRSRIRRKDGAWRQLAWSAQNAIGVPGVDGIVINAHDITAAVNLELQLMQAQKMEAIGRLAGGIAHDFNNIIGVISGFAGFLLQDLPGDAAEHRFAARIAKAAGEAKDLVQQILAFSRQGGIERKPHDLAHILRETGDLLRASLPASTHLEIASPAGALVARVNAAQISQILFNLCFNANDALMNEPGRITIEISRLGPGDTDHALFADGSGAPPPSGGRAVIGGLRPERSYARIAVSDTGTGMAPALLEHIFEPFFTTKERGQGTGLGLAVVHGTVMAYEGACVVTSQPGVGSVFTIYLPLAEGEADAAAPTAPAILLGGRERILVIDDDPDTTDVLTIGLDRLGYEVVALNDPEEALATFSENPAAWDVVISDQIMPHIKGLTLFERLRALRPTLRFVLCSGESGERRQTLEQRALDAGVDAFIHKPATPEQFAAAIRRLIDQSADASAPLP
jgi:PAS domain S-box-containing protein